MRVMARIGSRILEAMGTDRPFVPAMHSLGAPPCPQVPPPAATKPWNSAMAVNRGWAKAWMLR